MRLLDAKEVAQILKVKPARVYALARAGLLPSVRLTRQVRFMESSIKEFLERGGTLENQEKERRS
jgi:excisionase family DNA binding protein